MGRTRKGAARAAAPGSIFVWAEVNGGRALLSRKRAEKLGLSIGLAPTKDEDTDEETAADARSEAVTPVDVADAGDVPTIVDGEPTESVTPITTAKSGARKPAAKKRSTSTRSRRTR